jgi:uncharacterized protein
VILEGIVTTMSHDDVLNIAPMGPRLGPDLSMEQFELRPYRTSMTFQNLKSRGEGVFHITDDVLLLAQTAIGMAVDPLPEVRPAGVVTGWILARACRYYEFRTLEFDDKADRARIVVETVADGRIRDFLGFNRARHAVVEAAILATRTAFLPRNEILSEFQKLSVIVSKTGGPVEDSAFRLLQEHVLGSQETSSLDPPPPAS